MTNKEKPPAKIDPTEIRKLDSWNPCHYCGTSVCQGYEWSGKRHWLSDCRPDLVEHEIGPTCTWYGCEEITPNCYAYFKGYPGREWDTKHIHFENDGPM
jgi:hypothetical protein